METLLLLTYAAICYAAFRIFRIPANKWTVPTAFIGGFILVGLILLGMNYNHPFTRQGRFFFYTTPITPAVRGRVIEVAAQPNVPLKQGDILFRIDPRPFQDTVDRQKAALAEAEQSVRELKAAWDAAKAETDEANSARDRAKDIYDRYAQGNREARSHGEGSPLSEIEVENRRATWLEAEATALAASAKANQARLAYEVQVNGVNTGVARIRAALDDAEFNLEQATVRAPTDGFVTQVFLRPGMMTVPFPISPVMVFVHAGDPVFAAAFPQNALQRVGAGDEAELAFDAIPGRVFAGRVRQVIGAMAEGQLQPAGRLSDFPVLEGRGRVIAVLDVEADLSGYHLPAGASAEVAVYTDHWRTFALIRRILLRMRSWQNYVFL